jgi:DNA-binding transcriptional MocR family regulator
VVIEDESLVELALDDDPPPKPLAFHHDGVLTVGSASKPFWGGLRVGWIRGPAELIRRLRHYKTVFDLATPTTTQLATCLLLERSEEILGERQRQLRTQQQVLSRALAALLPDWEWSPPAGGLSLWAALPSGSATELAQVALRHGLALVPGPFFDPHGHHDRFLRLPYVLPPASIEAGVGRLARAWAQYAGRTATASDTA